MTSPSRGVTSSRRNPSGFFSSAGVANPGSDTTGWATSYGTYPYGESLLTLAEDREFSDIVRLLREYASRPAITRPAETSVHGVGDIEFPEVDEERTRFGKLVAANALVRFDPSTERFTVVTLPSSPANVRQLLGRPGEVWGAESGVDKLVVVRTG